MRKNEKRRAKRGGARPGAGRPATVSFKQKLEIGLACQEAWSAASAQKSNAKFIAKKRPEHMIKVQREMREQIADEKLSRQEAAAKLQEKGALTFHKNKRVYHVSSIRPYRLKATIIADVAKKFSCSERMVQTAWTEVRKLKSEAMNMFAPEEDGAPLPDAN